MNATHNRLQNIAGSDSRTRSRRGATSTRPSVAGVSARIVSKNPKLVSGDATEFVPRCWEDGAPEGVKIVVEGSGPIRLPFEDFVSIERVGKEVRWSHRFASVAAAQRYLDGVLYEYLPEMKSG